MCQKTRKAELPVWLCPNGFGRSSWGSLFHSPLPFPPQTNVQLSVLKAPQTQISPLFSPRLHSNGIYRMCVHLRVHVRGTRRTRWAPESKTSWSAIPSRVDQLIASPLRHSRRPEGKQRANRNKRPRGRSPQGEIDMKGGAVTVKCFTS